MKIDTYQFETLDSTNNWANKHADSFDRSALTVVSTSHQTSGRGRLGRHWHSPAGKNIYATFCIFIDPHRNDLGNLPQVMALEAANIIRSEGFNPKLKWPNDLLLQNKKIGGILSETQMIGNLLFFAIGVGINVNMTPEEAAMIDRPVTSLFIESGNVFELQHLLQRLTEKFSESLQFFITNGFADFLPDYRLKLVHETNGELLFRDAQRSWNGRFVGINSDGSLSMQLDNGEIKKFISGELLEF